MAIFFLIIGTLSAMSIANDKDIGINIAFAVVAVGCYGYAVILRVLGKG